MTDLSTIDWVIDYGTVIGAVQPYVFSNITTLDAAVTAATGALTADEQMPEFNRLKARCVEAFPEDEEVVVQALVFALTTYFDDVDKVFKVQDDEGQWYSVAYPTAEWILIPSAEDYGGGEQENGGGDKGGYGNTSELPAGSPAKKVAEQGSMPATQDVSTAGVVALAVATVESFKNKYPEQARDFTPDQLAEMTAKAISKL
ncbi:hypothetical protein [Kitasatospora mediocidica]|uniref:hypothetical protein n=1 Tax=Kitasatospora mediocidica TaxID=58352 RepID=UPI00055BDECA|nr:hypothetical protein [Kitasatospora mediocidica]